MGTLRNVPPQNEAINNVYEIKTKPELIRYYHAAAGLPTQPTWIAAINNRHYTSWPGLTKDVAAKYFLESDETWKGHGRKIKSELRSTKQLIATEMESEITIETKDKKSTVFTI